MTFHPGFRQIAAETLQIDIVAVEDELTVAAEVEPGETVVGCCQEPVRLGRSIDGRADGLLVGEGID